MTHDATTPSGPLSAATDATLVDRLQTGDSTALAPIYDRHAEVVFAVILRVVHDRATAEDLLQETFTRAWQRIATFDPARGQVRSWLIGIGHNLALNELRRRRRHPQEEPTGDDLAPIAAVEPGPLEHAIAAQRRQRLHEAIATLPASGQAAVTLYAAGHSQSEIAVRLNEPLGTIKSRLRRSLGELRKNLAATGQVSIDA